MSTIILSTINARYVHAALGLRYLRANMGDLHDQTQLMEFILGDRPADMAERLLAQAPTIIGFGVYIWNVEETTRLVAILKQIAPQIVIIVGGPEVSYECEAQRICSLADYVITGWGEVSFSQLCAELLSGVRSAPHVIKGVQAPLKDIIAPYYEYTEEDITRRFIYVEASRGCPFKCEFCLSALDKTAWPFELPQFLAQLEALYQRGARHFRFVDRTFNLKINTSLAILEFFLARMSADLFVHFELIPDHLPDKLKAAIMRFPKGALHFEVGIQTWDVAVQARISRQQDNDLAMANLRWLREASPALIHVDLIAGLPGEDLASFGRGFDQLYDLRPHEIQVGILKRLRGAPIDRHTIDHAMRYSPDPPYVILSTGVMSFSDVQRVVRFARFWDLVGNSGRFPRALPLLLATQPYQRFMQFSDWLYGCTGKTHQFALEKLCGFIYIFLTTVVGIEAELVSAAVCADYEASGAKGRLPFMSVGVRPERAAGRAKLRQARHVTAVESTPG
jgi:hypothetical protein